MINYKIVLFFDVPIRHSYKSKEWIFGPSNFYHHKNIPVLLIYIYLKNQNINYRIM